MKNVITASLAMETSHDYSVFNPKTYLEEYYSTVPPENVAHLRFMVKAFASVLPSSLTLDFGGGPTLYTLLVAAGKVHNIHYSDYLQANRDEMQKWLRGDADAFNWQESVREVLEMEGKQPSPHNIAARERLIRRHVKRVLACDVTQCSPIEGVGQAYDVLVSNLCIEAVAKDKGQWKRYLRHVTSLLKPGGKLIMTAVRGGNAYSVGQNVFHVLPIFEPDFEEALPEIGFIKESIQIEWSPADHPVYPYEGLLFVTATKG
jgi:hypothetical protein